MELSIITETRKHLLRETPIIRGGVSHDHH